MMKIKCVFLSLVILIALSTYATASEEHERKGSMMGREMEKPSPAIEVGNEVCPVSGAKVGSKGPVVRSEYKGKIYNFCCDNCVKTFKMNPEQYVKVVEGADRAAVKGDAPDASVKEFVLEAYQYAYSPESIVVNKGDKVKIHATSRDVPHGIFIKEYGINVTVRKGTVEEIEFAADKEGSFDIICSVYCGQGHHSMKGKLIVKE